jgi:hypothetical protein
MHHYFRSIVQLIISLNFNKMKEAKAEVQNLENLENFAVASALEAMEENLMDWMVENL